MLRAQLAKAVVLPIFDEPTAARHRLVLAIKKPALVLQQEAAIIVTKSV